MEQQVLRRSLDLKQSFRGAQLILQVSVRQSRHIEAVILRLHVPRGQ